MKSATNMLAGDSNTVRGSAHCCSTPSRITAMRVVILGVATLVSYISRFMTLYPGDLISTGTPPGVGMGQKPPIFLKPGDEIRLGIQGLGEHRQRVHAWDPALIDG